MAPFFIVHPGVQEHLVPALLNLYKDVEFTERENNFYLKFDYRTQIAELLEWLWTIPEHREAQMRVGAQTVKPSRKGVREAWLVRSCEEDFRMLIW
jgi:hypothetical protein